MPTALLDVNVLVALFDAGHPHHEAAHRWFKANRSGGWATCAVTINGCARVLSNPSYPGVETTTPEVIRRLDHLCHAKDHQFWAKGISLADEERFQRNLTGPHDKITDIYLLGMAVAHRGYLVTLDRKIPLGAVVAAEEKHLTVLRG
ncbi:MAG: PIN domain-containing protein [Acidimicrobiia bacterium]|nr:PIN domain-containing protein [Acidimicrobiia bacterium]